MTSILMAALLLMPALSMAYSLDEQKECKSLLQNYKVEIPKTCSKNSCRLPQSVEQSTPRTECLKKFPEFAKLD